MRENIDIINELQDLINNYNEYKKDSEDWILAQQKISRANMLLGQIIKIVENEKNRIHTLGCYAELTGLLSNLNDVATQLEDLFIPNHLKKAF